MITHFLEMRSGTAEFQYVGVSCRLLNFLTCHCFTFLYSFSFELKIRLVIESKSVEFVVFLMVDLNVSISLVI